VQIVRPQTRMMEVYMTDAGDQQMKVQLRALDESLAEGGRLHKLTELAAIDPGMLCLFAAATHREQLANIVCASAPCSTMFLAKHASKKNPFVRDVLHTIVNSCLAVSNVVVQVSGVNLLLSLPACCSQVSHNCAKRASALSSHYVSSSNLSISACIHNRFPMQLRQQNFQHGEGQAALPSGLPQIQQPSMWARATATQPTCTETACQQWSAPRTVPGMCTGQGTWPGRACQS